ncbi:MAG: MMPL family transporter, partial [Solirubrobacterales bacterium]|nr:MMPL family transporter [Solirubrobacterales bacterium]
MKLAHLLHRAAALAARRPGPVIAVTVVLALVGTALALRLQPDAGTDTLVGKGTDSYEATATFRERFGDDAVLVLVRGDLAKLVLTDDLGRLLGLEGCVSGNAPPGATPPGGPGGPCAQLARTKPVQVVFGPATFINESVRQLSDGFSQRLQQSQAQARAAADRARKQARDRGLGRAEADRRAKQAGDAVEAQFQREVLQLAVRYGLNGVPRLDDPDFVSTLVFDSTKPAGTPKRKFSYLFPTRGGATGRAALVTVRLRPDLSEPERTRAIDLVKAATRMDEWKLRNGGAYTVTGAPVVVSDLTESITGSIIALLIAALLVMAATLALVFSSRLRLLPLAVALVAAALTFGALSAAGASLTMASIAVLPVLIGLAVDYAIQLQSRISEERGDTSPELAAGPAA